MKLTKKQANLVRSYLEYYYNEHKNCTDALPFKTQMQLLYDKVSHLVK